MKGLELFVSVRKKKVRKRVLTHYSGADAACFGLSRTCRRAISYNALEPRKAGLDAWPKPWHNLRSTRQTELAERYPMHVVCQWIGNSRAVAQEHYLQVTDAHFIQAVAEPASKPEQAAQNPAQSAAVTGGKCEVSPNPANEKRSALPSDSDAPRYFHIEEVPATGVEHITRSPEKAPAHFAAKRSQGLAEVLREWSKLPANVRAQILSLIRVGGN